MKCLFILILLFTGCQKNQITAPPSKALYDTSIQAILEEQKVKMTYDVSVEVKEPTRIESNWFRRHKGEVKLKVIINFKGNNYRIKTYHKGLFNSFTNTFEAKSTTERIQNYIKKNYESQNLKSQ